MSRFSVVLITQDDPFYVRAFFEEFLCVYSPLADIRAVVIAPAMGRKSKWSLAKQMLGFYGLRDFVRVSLRLAAYRAAERAGRWLHFKRFYSIEQVCRHYGIAVIREPDINSPTFLATLRTMKPDLIVSVAAPQIFKTPLITLPRLGCINIHHAPLPRYKGMLPNFWQMYHGERTAGITIHRINERIDDGEILARHETPIAPDESLHELIVRTKRLGARYVAEAIDALKRGALSPAPARTDAPSYFTFPKRADVKEFKRRGYRLL